MERCACRRRARCELNSQNLALLYGAGQIEDQFCAAMEYVQGNSIATMLARHEGFLDLGSTRYQPPGVRRTRSCRLDGVVHHSLEPAKIMVQWDGLVKLLGYGISKMSLLEIDSEGKVGRGTTITCRRNRRGGERRTADPTCLHGAPFFTRWSLTGSL